MQLPQAYPQFRMAFKESTACFTPNGFSSLQRQLKDESRGLGLRPALALLRLSQFDPDVFYKFKQARGVGMGGVFLLCVASALGGKALSECPDVLYVPGSRFVGAMRSDRSRSNGNWLPSSSRTTSPGFS